MELSILLALLSPLVGASSVGLLMPWMKKERLAQKLTCLCMTVATIAAFFVVYQTCILGKKASFHLFTFLETSTIHVSWGVHLDALSGVMVGVVTSVSLMVHLYSIGYMKGDPSIPRFMAYISFFTFCMLLLVTAPHLLQLFVGWEGVGVASYLLIGYYYDRESACQASMKAFLVNRIGDVGFVLATCLVFCILGTFSFEEIFQKIPVLLAHKVHLPFWGEIRTLTLICALFFVGAMGKSAQLGLHVWLPDAMEGPTPVSALIHAATMVTAGIFLMVRLSPLLEYAPQVRQVILLLGGCTAFFAATVACTQTDVKRVIAYSTCSQLGYMFMAVGVSAYGAAMFHLTTHAFFKALLFLGAGSMIHALSGGQDLKEMGGLRRMIPFTYAAMWIGNLALAGIPFFAGYYSKDAILMALWSTASSESLIAFSLGIISAFLTAFYSWRLLFLAFHGKPRANPVVWGHVHESPPIMLGPLFFLSLGALFAGALFHSFFMGEGSVLHSVIFTLPDQKIILEASEHAPFLVESTHLIVAVSGIFLAFFFYFKHSSFPDFVAKQWKPFYLFFFKKWYFDELFQWILVNPFLKISNFFWQKGDMRGIDRLGPNGLAFLTECFSKGVSYLQTGYLYHYAFAIVLGFLGGAFFIIKYFYL
jgi:NADH-quinone oxidoreductase subunit L